MTDTIAWYICTASCTNQDWNADCDFAVVPLNKNLVDLVFRRVAAVKKMKSTDQSLYKTVHWCCQVEFFKFTDEFESRFPDLGGLEDFAIVFSDPEIDRDSIQRIECSSMNSSDDGVYWSAYPKHTGVKVETDRLLVKDLQKILGRFQ